MQQNIPHPTAGNGPVGNVYQKIIFIIYVPAPYREAKVIADQQQYIPPSVGDDRALATRCKMFCFLPHAKEVSFIVIISFSFGSQKKSTVVARGDWERGVTFITGYVTARNSQLEFCRPLTQG